ERKRPSIPDDRAERRAIRRTRRGPPHVLRHLLSRHQWKPKARTMKYAAGAAKRSASVRARKPPWPPGGGPGSFTSEARLRADSERPPTPAAATTPAPSTSDCGTEMYECRVS